MEDLDKLSQKMLDELVQIEKPLLILAGPGMGKTYTLAYKIKNLVETKKVYASEITVITFTKEAAINMRKRISLKSEKRVYVEQNLQPSVISTMHKLGDGILRNNCAQFGLKRDYSVLSGGLREVLVGDCAQVVGAKRVDAKGTIECRQSGHCTKVDSLKCKICEEYTKLLRRFNYIDHDDQLLLACELLSNNKDILDKERRKARYLLVDEYQDINYAQWELIRLLSGDKPESLFVVGDDYQSIYSFRGGSPQYIRNFEKDYAPDGLVRHLTISRRCPPNIFKGSFCMTQKYNGGYDDLLDKLRFTEESDTLIKICNFDHHNLEADFIARKVKEIGPSYEVLILVPSIYYVPPIKRALKKKYVDFSCAYDIERTDLYLVNVLLRWLEDPADNFSLRMLIQEILDRGATNIPAKQADSVGNDATRETRENALGQIGEFWKDVGERKTLYLKIKKLKDNPLFKELVNILTELRNSYKEEKVSCFASKMIDRLKIWQSISDFSKELNSAIDEIESLEVAGGESSVRILTMKKAKGLEADYVFVVGLENNILPREDKSKIEDSRLLYVSMTRAKKELYLLHSRVRNRNITKVSTAGRSEFVDSIPSQYIEEV